jgi:hypothetical protein
VKIRARLWLAVLACTVIWNDVFALQAAEHQYGAGVMEEVRVEVCGNIVSVSTRLFREIATKNKIIEQPIAPFKVAQTYWVNPSGTPTDAPVPAALPVMP